jgi:hypothetical protein
VQLTFDADVEAFRADFVAFLDEHLPSEADALDAAVRPSTRTRTQASVSGWPVLVNMDEMKANIK